ncbi:MAG: hypothetical protein MIO93_01410 [ANME-2 cluster archaeon]|jgi:hypothetical protein|nr:hypothetical protein [ANME-2 cluster archaeon]
MPGPVKDDDLIIWLKNNYQKIEFIVQPPDYQRVDRKERLIGNITNLKTDKKLYAQKDLLIEIWKDLVAMAVIYLKSKDKREFFHDDGDYGIDQLGDFFQNYCDFEKILYGNGDYYRDHVSHVFKVFLLGEKLVKEYLGGFSSIEVMDSKLLLNNLNQDLKESDEDYQKRTEAKLITADEKEAMWCIVSLTHDLGYPTEVVNDIHDNLKNMLTIFNIQDVSYILSQQSQMFNDSIVKLISSDLKIVKKSGEEVDKKEPPEYITHTQAKYYFKYSRSIEKWDHGVESCIVLVKSLVYFLETDYSIDERKSMDIDDARQFLIRQRILRAIASHNCDYIYHLKLDLSFLLRIIDEMQEWGRPNLNDLFIKTSDSSFSIDKFTKNDIEYTIRFSVIDGVTEADDKKKLHNNIKNYFKRCADKYIMILRSAVDGKERSEDKLILTLNVVDETEKEIKYKFKHPNPKDIELHVKGIKSSAKDYVEIKLEQLNEDDWDNFCEIVQSN